MDIFVYREGSGHVEEGFTVDQLPELLKDEQAVFWVDMESPAEADDHVLLDIFKFHPLTVEDCRLNRHHPKVEEFPDYIYFIVHAVRTDGSSDRFNTIELDGFLGRNYVVTYHHESFPSIVKVKQAVRSSPVSCQRGSAFLLHQIIDGIVDDYLPVMDDFDERINVLEDDIFAAVLPFYRDIYDHLVRVSDLAESYRDLISGSLEAYLSVVSNRLNEIMKVLTIFSAVMLPLTFIAGVYGMNFENMPELHSRYGYYGAWGIMILVAVVMLSLFWWRGWIGGGKGEKAKD
jgi:magnesium transporter